MIGFYRKLHLCKEECERHYLGMHERSIGWVNNKELQAKKVDIFNLLTYM